MLGRGIDQIQRYPAPPLIHEHYITSALDYVSLAERRNGSIPRQVAPAYVWGDSLVDIDAREPDLRIVNLETAVTLSEQYLAKGINYRMNPANLPCLSAARIDCVTLANNHVLDWGLQGLLAALEALEGAGIRSVGAGCDLEEAETPAILSTAAGGYLVVHAVGCPSSGVPQEWTARARRPGLHVVSGRRDASANRLAEAIAEAREAGDIVIVSIHWGGNWGYEIRPDERDFAHFLVEEAGVDIVHGHSSHHPRAVEVYRDRTILYGCGDFINDYEGIGGHETYRPDLVLAYLLTTGPDGAFAGLEMLPFRLERFRLNRATRENGTWLVDVLGREYARVGTGLTLDDEGTLQLAR
jgi:poly-gamma-glutamate synthesis protein (capsule biosynthesis protein)